LYKIKTKAFLIKRVAILNTIAEHKLKRFVRFYPPIKVNAHKTQNLNPDNYTPLWSRL